MKRALAEAKAATAIEEKLDGAAVKAEAWDKEGATTPESADAASSSEPEAPRTPKTPEATTVAKENDIMTPTP
ncbi:MAG: hypothetical protein Q9185_002664 [Variospora sp. 1 TL-2023]